MEDSLFYKFIRMLLKIFFNVLYRPKVIGIENIPKDGGVVLAGNHTRWLDPLFIITICPRQAHFLAKEELFHGITKPFLVGCGAIPVNRKIHDKDALIHGIETLQKKNCICIFPEATINKTENVILPFKIGAVKMAKDTDSKLVPFIITGKYKIFGKRVKIEFLQSYNLSGDLTHENEKLMGLVSNKLIEYKKGE